MALTFASRNPDDSVTVELPSEADTLALGARLATALQPGLLVYLNGELSAGKTTLVRGCLRALGYRGRVKSPTFTLVELYRFSRLYLHHFDFYRFKDSSEWIDAGFRDVFAGDDVCLVEWPEKAGDELPPADIAIRLEHAGDGRTAHISAHTEAGAECLARMIA
jgi:tRNA threonylcarbamoyladenosine biosynthesis protein TsaE